MPTTNLALTLKARSLTVFILLTMFFISCQSEKKQENAQSEALQGPKYEARESLGLAICFAAMTYFLILSKKRKT